MTFIFIEALSRILALAMEQLRQSGDLVEAVYRRMLDAILGQAIDSSAY